MGKNQAYQNDFGDKWKRKIYFFSVFHCHNEIDAAKRTADDKTHRLRRSQHFYFYLSGTQRKIVQIIVYQANTFSHRFVLMNKITHYFSLKLIYCHIFLT